MSGMNKNSSMDVDDLLWELNDEKSRLFIPVFVYIGILMLVGTTGNAMVLYFYGCKNKTSPSTCFILALAVFDLISCLVAMPMEIADLRFYFNFKSIVACRVLRMVSHFASISSGLTLVVIAIDRFKRICRPFDRQLNNKHVTVICVIVALVSIALSWPAILFNEVVDVNVPNPNNVTVIGHDCTTTKDERYQVYILVTNAVYVAAFVIITLVLATLYTLIGRQLFRHQKFRQYVARKGTKNMRTTPSSPLLQGNSDNSLTTAEETTIPSDRVFEDPPDATGSVVDLKEFVTRGLTQVESDRPSSGFTGLTRSTGLTLSTGISGQTKRSTQSIKSVKICEPSQNQVYPIEPRTISRVDDGETDSEWMGGENRVTSPSSFATFSSRPSSAALSEYSETETVKETDDDMGDVVTRRKLRGRELTIINEYMEALNDIERSETGMSEYECGTSNNTESKPNDKNNGTNNAASESMEDEPEEHSSNTIHAHEPVDTELNGATQLTVKQYVDIESNSNTNETAKSQQGTSADLHEQVVNEYDLTTTKVVNRIRPLSSSSGNSRRSALSPRFRKRNTVSPEGSTITTTTSVATSMVSRASTVRRFQSFLRYNSRSNKMETDTDRVKDLRMKMLDLNTMKYTVIMLIITIVFVISFLPYLSLVIWRYFKDEHEVNILSDLELVLFQIGIRSVFLNSSLNPVIYGGFNSHFRAFFYSRFCKCCKRKRNRKRKLKTRDHSDSTSGT